MNERNSGTEKPDTIRDRNIEARLEDDPKGISFSYFLIALLYAFFFPDFNTYLGSLGAIIINLGVMVLCAIPFMVRPRIISSRSLIRPISIFLVIFLVFLIHIPLSISIGSVARGVNIVFRDLFELHRPFMYAIVVLFSYFVFINKSNYNKLHYLLLFSFFVLAGFAINQFLAVSPEFSSLYTKQLNIHSRRVSSPFGNPYDYAFIMSFFVFYFMMCFLLRSKVYIIHLFLAFILIVLPQSRSVAAILLVGFFVFAPAIMFLINFRRGGSIVPKYYAVYLTIYLAIIALFLISIPFLISSFPYLTGQFIKLVQSGDIGSSAGTRLSQFLYVLDLASNPIIFIFGNGPSKDEMEYVESIMTYQMFRYGAVGVVFYFILPIVMVLYRLLRVIKTMSYKDRLYPLVITLIMWFSLVPFLQVGNNFTEQSRISFFFYSLIGVAMAISYIHNTSRFKS